MLGVYDPAGPHATTYLELLEFLTTLGASADELVAYRDDLPGLAAVVTVRADKPLTVSEAAKREGIATEQLRRLIRVAGFPEPARTIAWSVNISLVSPPAWRRRRWCSARMPSSAWCA